MGVPLFGQEPVDRYRETAGEEGHDWQGTTVLLLTTTEPKSGEKNGTTPLIYQRHVDDYLVVASNAGGDPPAWFLNLQHDPIVGVQVKADHHTARARVATAEEKPGLWRIMTATAPSRTVVIRGEMLVREASDRRRSDMHVAKRRTRNRCLGDVADTSPLANT